MGRGYSVEQWERWIDEQQASGVSITAFCESIGVSQNAFYVRRRQLAQQPHRAAAGFVSLTLAPTDNAAENRAAEVRAVIEVELPGGAVVRVNEAHVVRDVVAALLEYGVQRCSV